MAKLVEYGTFLIEHLVFGLFLFVILYPGANSWAPNAPAERGGSGA